jgi:beta-glucosidase
MQRTNQNTRGESGNTQRENDAKNARPVLIKRRFKRRSALLGTLAPLALLLAVIYPPVGHAQSPAPTENCPLRNGRDNSAPAPKSFPWLDSTLDANTRVELLFAQLTVEEKVDLATGESCGLYGFFNAPIPRLKIPALTMADGPAGVRVADQATNGGLATAMPAPIALAAGWDTADASKYGDLLGREAILTGHNVMLGPAIDIVRGPRGGRGFETFGEDPLLQSEIAVPYVAAIQTHPVLANAKHAAAYNQETDRLDGIDVILGERALREIYLPPFEAVIERADVGTAMCAFNKLNGFYECEDKTVMTDVLKDAFGLQGFIMSDFGATHSTVAAALAGLDQEQPGGEFFGQLLLDAVNNNEVPMDVLDDKARRVLRPMFQFKLFDQPVHIGTLATKDDGAIARDIEEHSIVLLKNANNALPLPTSGISSIAVIGSDANTVTAAGGGSSHVNPTYEVSPLQGIENRVGSAVKVTYTAGTDPVSGGNILPGGETAIPSSVLTPTGGASGSRGLLGSYWLNTNFSGTPAVTRVDRQVSLVLGFLNFGLNAQQVPGLPTEFTSAQFSARWTGTLTAPATGQYTLTLTTRGRGTLFLDGNAIIADTESHATAPSSATVQLTAGVAHDIRIDYISDSSTLGGPGGVVGGEALLSWTTPEGTVDPGIAEAAAAAKAADVAIVYVRDYETEGYDRPSLTLPNAEDLLIQQVVAANPRTIVVLQTGLPVTMPWLGSVPAVLEAWYGGQEQGNSIAAVLFGDVNPSGKLPVTFPVSEALAAPASPPNPAQFPGVDLDVTYSEGIYVGYRWYDHFKVDPLFPFGFGLSYTQFTYSGLKVDSGSSESGLQSPIKVTFTVTNSGSRAGSEVAQVYVGTLPASIDTPSRQLAGFARVDLAAGATTTVTVQIDARSVSYWDTTTHAWVTPSGEVPIYVGSSSRDIRQTGSAQVGLTSAATPVANNTQ